MRRRIIGLAAAILLGVLGPSIAGVSVSVERHDNIVQGSSAGELMVSLNKHPVAGDDGRAYASTHPEFSLEVTTRERGGMCAAKVDVAVHFTVTLPRAASPGRMGGRTRRAWNAFVAFTQRHEAHHQQSYTDCARRFVREAETMSAPQCGALQRQIAQGFTKMQRDCEVEQREFDLEQRPLAGRLELFMLGQLDLL
jgi:predicted secreted Zn-dependent protease